MQRNFKRPAEGGKKNISCSTHDSIPHVKHMIEAPTQVQQPELAVVIVSSLRRIHGAKGV